MRQTPDPAVDISATLKGKLIIVTLAGRTDDISISFKLTKTEGRKLADVIDNEVTKLERRIIDQEATDAI